MKNKLILTGGIDVGNSDTKSYLNVLEDPKAFLGNPISLSGSVAKFSDKSILV